VASQPVGHEAENGRGDELAYAEYGDNPAEKFSRGLRVDLKKECLCSFELYG
jgi:hypothetical protein